MRLMIIVISILSMLSCRAQNNPESIISEFIGELRTGQISNEDLVKKYFILSDSLSQEEVKKTVIPILAKQFDLVREKLNRDCNSLEIFDYTYSSERIKSLVLKTDSLNTKNIYYISCGDSVLLPVLIKNVRIQSIMTYSKTQNGSRSFIVF